MKTKKNKLVLLKGEGAHQHVLHGEFETTTVKAEMNIPEGKILKVKNTSELKHEKIDGSWSNEHHTLEMETGIWVLGRQVEYNPITLTEEQIWD